MEEKTTTPVQICYKIIDEKDGKEYMICNLKSINGVLTATKSGKNWKWLIYKKTANK